MLISDDFIIILKSKKSFHLYSTTKVELITALMKSLQIANRRRLYIIWNTSTYCLRHNRISYEPN